MIAQEMMRSARDAISDLPDVRGILDTRRGEDVRGIGHAEGNVLIAYHVTDRPHEIVRLLRRRPNLVSRYGEKGKTAELGPGFYTSGNPGYWVGRARGKWNFLGRLPPGKIYALTGALTKEVEEDRSLTESERTRALRDIRLVETGIYDPEMLTFLANLPYAIPFWQPSFLRPLGITPGETPGVVELKVRGRFAELTRSHPPASLLRTLRRAGLQGAFTRSGISTNPELVIWDPRAVISARVEPAEGTARDHTRPKRRPVSDYRLARRVYWTQLKRHLGQRYRRVPTSEGHRVADEAFRRKVPVATLAARMAGDRHLSSRAPEVHVESLMRIR